MRKTNKLTYSIRRKLSKKKIFSRTLVGVLGLTLAITIGDLIINPSIISNLKKNASNYLEQKVDELDKNTYSKLIKYVKKQEQIDPIPYQGWRNYTEVLFKKYPCANEKASFNEWTTFLKEYNGGGNPIIGKKIKFPKLNCE